MAPKYEKAAQPSDGAAAQATQQRLSQIQQHFAAVQDGGRLKGKVCILTGVGSPKGIGRASAVLFAKEGAKALYLLDFNGEGLPALQEDLQKRFPNTKVLTQEADAADEEVIQKVCDRAIEEHGRLDVFFANAGIATGNTLPNIDFDDFENTLRVNTLSCFVACKHASAAMQRVQSPDRLPGSIIMTASVAGLRSGAGSSDYSASKAAVVSLAQTCAWQLAGTGIRVNAILPGLIETGMTAPTFDYARSKGSGGKIGQLNPMRRYGVAEEIAPAVLFLASDESSYVNGIALPVDGGLAASLPVAPGRFF